jgi:hypothetical protein
MKSRLGYKGYVIEARSYQQRDGGFSAELWIEEHAASGVTETQFYLPASFRPRTWRLRQGFKPGGRRSTWALSGNR